MGMYEAIKNTFELKDVRLEEYSPLTLAYLGDCVYELIIRTKLVSACNAPVNKLNSRGSRLAKASTQAAIAEAVMAGLSKEEEAVYKRGRNANSPTKAKNATIADYRKATGLETLIGYLYLQQKFDRITELIKAGFEEINVI